MSVNQLMFAYENTLLGIWFGGSMGDRSETVSFM